MYRPLQHRLLMSIGSAFDPAAFASGSFEGKGDTRRLQIEAKEYPALIVGPFNEKTKIRVTDKGKVILDVVWQPDDPAQAQQLGLEKLPTVRQSVFLDMTPGGGLDMGPFKNGDLNRLREVLGLNGDGVKWSFQDFIGKTALIKVEYRPNEADPQNPFSNVTKVAKLG